MRVPENIDYTSRKAIPQLLEAAVAELPNLMHGEIFLVSELFYGYQWKRIPTKDRNLLGRYFLDFAQSEKGMRQIEVIELSGQKKLRYVRK
ncbi:MAG: single-stranded DNA-binding protein [Oscillospiraceae bacterium]|jgi:hypothetical protein|nr:single-stranded DNA-binding protein [Oscillospiraceae bacterium]